MESLVICGSTLVNVDNHGGSSLPAEESLEQLGELAFSEGDVAAPRSDGQQHKSIQKV